MANSFTNVNQVLAELMVDFQYQSPLIGTMWKDPESSFTRTDGWDIGKTVSIGLPNQYLVTDGAVISSIPDFNEKNIDLTLDKRKKIPMSFTTDEMTNFTKFKFKERIMNPATDTLSTVVEADLAEKIFKKTYLVMGQAGTTPSSFNAVARLRAGMNKMGIPKKGRWLMFDEDSYTDVSSASTIQNSFDSKLTRDINRDVQLGRLASFQTFSSAVAYQHIAGIGDGTATPAVGLVSCGNVKTTVTSGNTLILENLPNSQADTLRVGDKLIFGLTGSISPFHINPKTKQTTNISFSITLTDVGTGTTTSGGELTVTFEPSIVSSATDAYRNISDTSGLQALTEASLVTANTGVGSATKVPYKLNIGYIKPALAFAAPPLKMPEGIPDQAKSRVIDRENGLSLRIYTFTNGTNDEDTKRLDILYGLKVYNPLVFGLLG